jgi:hypothetical protein
VAVLEDVVSNQEVETPIRDCREHFGVVYDDLVADRGNVVVAFADLLEAHTVHIVHMHACGHGKRAVKPPNLDPAASDVLVR